MCEAGVGNGCILAEWCLWFVGYSEKSDFVLKTVFNIIFRWG